MKETIDSIVILTIDTLEILLSIITQLSLYQSIQSSLPFHTMPENRLLLRLLSFYPTINGVPINGKKEKRRKN